MLAMPSREDSTMKRRLAAITLALASSGVLGQHVAWTNEPGGVAVARDPADHVFTARWDANPAGDIHVARRSASGALLWEVRYDNMDSTRDEAATFVAADSTGNVLVSGTIRSGFSNPVNAASLLMKFSPDGQLLWRAVYGSSFDGSSTRRVVMDPQDRAHVLGVGVCPGGLVATVRQFHPDGSPGWTWCDSAGVGLPTMIKRTPDGQFVVAGRSIFGSIQGFVRIDAAGHPVWSLAGIPSLTVGDIAGDAQGNSYLVCADPGTGQGTRLRKVSPGGVTLWERAHPMSAFRVEVGPDGAPVLGGFPGSGTGGAAFAKFSADGDLLWTNPDASGVGLLLHSAMLVDADGAAYLSGSTLVEMGVAKVHADGSTAWSRLLPGGTTTGMALGSVNQVYVSGGIYTTRIDQLPEPVVFTSSFE
jgi:outer membrane protein assembly factor BamB